MTRVDGDWRTTPETQAVCAALTAGGFNALFVGGCVRNALLGAPVSDIDLATDARPEKVVTLAQAAGLKAVPTGIDHGTITVVSGGVPHEITTFRRDVGTDGRRAIVAFSTHIEEDAVRRDFTMNALYAQPDGTVIDPVGGYPDLLARRLRFIGDASQRIREDYLRSLRYFRFLAWYGDPDRGPEADALDAIAANLDGLDQLSRERIGAEVVKLLLAPDPAPALATMRAIGVMAHVLPGADDRGMAILVEIEQTAGLPPKAERRLAAIGARDLAGSLRLSRAQVQQVEQIATAASSSASATELGYRHGADLARDAMVLRQAALHQRWSPSIEADVTHGAARKLPVTAHDLMPALSGVDLGNALKDMEARWIASGFRLSRGELLQGLDPTPQARGDES
ncbi:MAG: CCA tRNA nucleotidyltransferase [Pseudomonadota bacterium]